MGEYLYREGDIAYDFYVIRSGEVEVSADGETVALLGTNGNGKSTLMKCIMGIVRPSAGTIVAEIDGKRHDLVGRTTEQIVDLGIALVPEGRHVFAALTVMENLEMGAYSRGARPHRADQIRPRR